MVDLDSPETVADEGGNDQDAQIDRDVDWSDFSLSDLGSYPSLKQWLTRQTSRRAASRTRKQWKLRMT